MVYTRLTAVRDFRREWQKSRGSRESEEYLSRCNYRNSEEGRTGAATQRRAWRVQWVSSKGRWARRGLDLGSVATHSLPPLSLEKERGSGYGADHRTTREAAAESEAPPSASQSLPAPKGGGTDTL